MVKGERDKTGVLELSDLLAEFGVPKISFPEAEEAFWSWVKEQRGMGVDTSSWWENGNGNGNKGNILRAVFIVRFSVVNGKLEPQSLDEFTKKMNLLMPEDNNLFSLLQEINKRFTP